MPSLNQKQNKIKRVAVFGAFDPLHAGHLNFFQQARQLGEKLVAVIARDSTILNFKKRPAFQNEVARAEALRECGLIDEVYLGYEGQDRYRIFDELDFDVIALGYDQKPSESEVASELDRRGKFNVSVVRLNPYHPDRYKSTFLR